jgi:hypothetical protein
VANLIKQRISGNFVTIDLAKHRRRFIDAEGPDVIKVLERFLNPILAAADAPVGYTVTLVEAGAGESTITKPDGVDGGLLFTTDANEDDGINFQLAGESFKASSSCQLLYFYARFKASEATQIDWLIGLCITDTTLLGGMTDGIYFEKLDGGTGISFVTEKNSTETQTDSLGTFAADTEVEVEFVYDKASATVYAFINGAQVAAHTTNIVDDEDLTPSLHVLAGSAAARTFTWKEYRAIQIGY